MENEQQTIFIDWEKEALKIKLQLSETKMKLLETESNLRFLQQNKCHEMEKLRLEIDKLKALQNIKCNLCKIFEI